MTAQTVTTVENYDSAAISGLNNGETLTINGGSVTIDEVMDYLRSKRAPRGEG